jgi:predicted 3-demethylubiquinone-9 3-methyltransferase (glyoxalase superfamily)
MQKITPFLWFDGQAEEAMNFYVSIFKNSKVGRVTRYGEGGPGPKGTVMSATFQLEGQEFMALNGGPQFMRLAIHEERYSWSEHNRKWMSFGRSFPQAVKKRDAAG